MPNDPTPSVDLARLTDELDNLFEGTSVYVNRRTGAIVTVTDEELSAVEEREDDEDLKPEGGEQMLAILQSIVETSDWVAMPDKSDIHEWELMRDFSASVGGAIGGELDRAIRGRGAFRMFRDVLDRHELDDDWFEFKRKSVEKIAVDALEAENIPFRRGK